MKLVRLKPYNPKQNQFLKRYTVSGRRFHHSKWYRVSDEVGDYLSGVYSRPDRPDRPDSVLAFNVCKNKKEAAEVVREEKRRKRRGGDLATRHLRGDASDFEEVDLEQEVAQADEMAALALLDGPESTRRVHEPSREDAERRRRPPPARAKPAEAKRAAAKKAPARGKAKAKPKAKGPARGKDKAKGPARGKATVPNPGKNKSNKMPSELDAATWADDEKPPNDVSEVDPFES